MASVPDREAAQQAEIRLDLLLLRPELDARKQWRWPAWPELQSMSKEIFVMVATFCIEELLLLGFPAIEG